MPTRRRQMELMFPFGGIHKGAGFQKQPPYTTPDCENVRPYSTIDGRAVGGSRPGMDKSFLNQLGSGNPVRMLAGITYMDESGYRSIHETWPSTTLSTAWSFPDATYPNNTNILKNGWLDDVIGSPTLGGNNSIRLAGSRVLAGYYCIGRTIPHEDASATGAVRLSVWLGAASNGQMFGSYEFYIGEPYSDDSGSGDNLPAGYVLRLDVAPTGYYGKLTQGTGTTYAYDGSAKGRQVPGWLVIDVTAARNMTVTWDNQELFDRSVVPTFGADADSDYQIAIGLSGTVQNGSTVSNPSWYATVDYKSVVGDVIADYLDGSTAPEPRRRTQLMASSNGSVYKSAYSRQMSDISATPTLASDRRIHAVERGQKLYIADWGDPVVKGTDGVLYEDGRQLTAAAIADWTAQSIDSDDEVCVVYNGEDGVENGTYRIIGTATGYLQLENFSTGATIGSGVGGGFANQPANDAVEILSSSAGDVAQKVTIIGVTDETVTAETKTLTGTSAVTTTKIDWDEILAVKLDAVCGGTITIREASGNATIITIAAGDLDKGVITVDDPGDQLAYETKPTVVSSAAGTKMVGIAYDGIFMSNDVTGTVSGTPANLGGLARGYARVTATEAVFTRGMVGGRGRRKYIKFGTSGRKYRIKGYESSTKIIVKRRGSHDAYDETADQTFTITGYVIPGTIGAPVSGYQADQLAGAVAQTFTTDATRVLEIYTGDVAAAHTVTVKVGNIEMENGSCSYRITRGPKVYDPSDDSLALMYATDGFSQVPTGCPLIARYRDRIVLAGSYDAPHVWYMSRQGDPEDWDYSEDGSDAKRAVAGTDADAGTIGEPITALVTHSDDYMVIGCVSSLWQMNGDPAFGGNLINLSETVGILSAGAWCYGPNGEIVFLSAGGLYMLRAGGQAKPKPISNKKLPVDLAAIDPNVYTISMAYDTRLHGVHITLAPSSATGNKHWWMDWDTQTFWPDTYQGDHEPFIIHTHNADTSSLAAPILGCRDGYLRRFSNDAEQDDGSEIESYVKIGPIALAGGFDHGMLKKLVATLAEGSGDVSWEVATGQSAESVLDETALANDTFTVHSAGGLNYTVNPMLSGATATVKLSNGTTYRRWAIERVLAVIRAAGPQRL